MNPKWSEQELLLAYDLYLTSGRRTLSERNPAVIALSTYLKTLPWHADKWQDTQFRNARGLCIKLQQLKAYEEERSAPSVHLGAQALARKYRDQPDLVHPLALAIRASVAAQLALPSDDPEAEEQTFYEGRLSLTLHYRRERSQRAVNLKLASVKAATGQLACEVCGFDFEATYGQLGRGFAECHHLLPLGEIGERDTALDDLAVVCANCHRMLHHRTPSGALLSLDELKSQLRSE